MFPSKPIIRSTETSLPALKPGTTGGTPQKVTGSNAALLSRWGWKFSFSLVNGVGEDTVHVTVRYPQYQPASAELKDLDLAADWYPVSLLNSLVALKLLRDNRDSAAIGGKRLGVLDDLAQSLLRYLSLGPVLSAQPDAPVGGDNDSLDVFTVGFLTPGIANDSRQVMKGPIEVTWTPPSKETTRIDTAILEALGASNGNNACLTGTSPVRGYKLSLTLKRNEAFVGRPANGLLVYQCAPVESPVDCRPLNLWGQLVFDMTGQTLESALQAFFDSIFHQADLTQLSMEAGISLSWSKGSMSAVTAFSILPADLKPADGTAHGVATFVHDKCVALLGTGVLQPPDTDSAAIRLRVKITAPDKDTPTGPRTLLEITAIDFPLPAA